VSNNDEAEAVFEMRSKIHRNGMGDVLKVGRLRFIVISRTMISFGES
jgi:hypothetical protein